jgi:hypothetical protein
MHAFHFTNHDPEIIYATACLQLIPLMEDRDPGINHLPGGPKRIVNFGSNNLSHDH